MNQDYQNYNPYNENPYGSGSSNPKPKKNRFFMWGAVVFLLLTAIGAFPFLIDSLLREQSAGFGEVVVNSATHFINLKTVTATDFYKKNSQDIKNLKIILEQISIKQKSMTPSEKKTLYTQFFRSLQILKEKGLTEFKNKPPYEFTQLLETIQLDRQKLYGFQFAKPIDLSHQKNPYEFGTKPTTPTNPVPPTVPVTTPPPTTTPSPSTNPYQF